MKPPAFQCYADDLLSGTSDMTAEEFGVYWRLICHSWNKGGLPNDDARLALMAGQCSGNAVAYAKAKFEVGADGLLRNARLEKVRAEQQNYSKSQSDKAHLRWSKERAKTEVQTDAAAMPLHLPDGCSPTPSPSPSTKRESSAAGDANLPTWPDVKSLADGLCIPEKTAKEFFDHHEGNRLWTNKHGFLVNVKVKLQIWHNNNRQGAMTNGNNRSFSKTGTDRNAGTANAGKSHRYAGAAERV